MAFRVRCAPIARPRLRSPEPVRAPSALGTRVSAHTARHGVAVGASAPSPSAPASSVVSPAPARAPVTTVENTTPAAASPTPAATPEDVRALVREARKLLDANRPATAESLVLRATAGAPENAGAWNVLGRAQLALGRLGDAEDSFKRACS